jgi:hypothetical protein
MEDKWEPGMLVKTVDADFIAYYFSLGGLMSQTVTKGDRYDEKLWVNKKGITFKVKKHAQRHLPAGDFIGVFFPNTRESLFIEKKYLIIL